MIKKVSIIFLILFFCFNLGTYGYFQIPIWKDQDGTTEVNAESANNF